MKELDERKFSGEEVPVKEEQDIRNKAACRKHRQLKADRLKEEENKMDADLKKIEAENQKLLKNSAILGKQIEAYRKLFLSSVQNLRRL